MSPRAIGVGGVRVWKCEVWGHAGWELLSVKRGEVKRVVKVSDVNVM